MKVKKSSGWSMAVHPSRCRQAPFDTQYRHCWASKSFSFVDPSARANMLRRLALDARRRPLPSTAVTDVVLAAGARALTTTRHAVNGAAASEAASIGCRSSARICGGSRRFASLPSSTLLSSARPYGTLSEHMIIISSSSSSSSSSSHNHYFQLQQSHFQRRHMSDNLLGHSPMARPDPRRKAADTAINPHKPLVGVDSNTEGGGVWAQTSAKRDKLGELKLEIDPDKRTLDEMASPIQKLDLDMADGLRLVARAVDGAWLEQSRSEDVEESASASYKAIQGVLNDLDEFLRQTEQSRGDDAKLSRERFDAYLTEVLRVLEPDAAAPSPSERLVPRAALARLRDFAVFDPEDGSGSSGEEDASGDDDETNNTKEDGQQSENTASASISIPEDVDSDLRTAERPFDECTVYLRLLTARHAASTLKESWDDLTKMTDGDVDRAAVRGEPADPFSSLPLSKVNDVVRAYAAGTCQDRTEALWKLWDKDDDGLIDEVEMDLLAHWSMKPVEAALGQLFAEALEELPAPEDVVAAAGAAAPDASSSVVPSQKGWRQRRREAKAKKKILKIFNKTIANHFEVEVETPHRLRCIYAWADKAHQNDKIDSVLVDSGTIAGRKRYVELAPKISLDEFRTVQQEHFAHYDRIGEEIISSFREDLLVDQGKGRQNKELKRDIVVFLGVVSAIDAVIWSL